jgi:type III restriction enzyme
MKLHFEPNLDYQLAAIESVCDLFRGQEICRTEFTVVSGAASKQMLMGFAEQDLGVGNRLALLNDEVLENLHGIQLRNGLAPSPGLATGDFTVEMETGTGKTYVYLRTIFELNRRYGFTKFVIVVPSVAIKEGVYHSIEIAEEHFRALYANTPFEFFLYDSSKLGQVRNFSTSPHIQIMVVTVGAINKKDVNNLYKDSEKVGGEKPIDLIKATRPIVIVDEPQSVDGGLEGRGKEALGAMNPLCTLRYSATHAERHHMVYRLDAIDAYERKLVKQIAVASGRIEGGHNKAYVRLMSVSNKRGTITARVEVDIEEHGKVRRKEMNVQDGDMLDQITGRDLYKDCRIGEIRVAKGKEHLEFRYPGGEVYLNLGDAYGDVGDTAVKREMIRRTIKEHLDKEKRLRPQGIKVLSLFFIDSVEKYRQYDADGHQVKGEYAVIFEEEYRRWARHPDYQTLFKEVDLKTDAAEVHDGYFSIDKKGGWTNTEEGNQSGRDNAERAYSLIMKDKERLLNLETPLKFIFSHSALKEGWDNPNVFQICALREMGSERQRRQTIGRGMRICVNQQGERVRGFDVNTLTVVATEGYEAFAENLQKEIEEDTGIRFGIVEGHVFAGVAVVAPDGTRTPLGFERSEEIRAHLQGAGYINSHGKVQECLKIALKDGTFALPEPFTAQTPQIKAILEKLTTKLVIHDADNAVQVKTRQAVLQSAEFKALWDRIKHKTTYRVEFDNDQLIQTCMEAIRHAPPVGKTRITWRNAELAIGKAGVHTREVRESAPAYLAENDIVLPDLLTELQDRTQLTRRSIATVLIESGRLDDFKRNPQEFIELVAESINRAKRLALVDGIKYQRLGNDCFYAQQLFEQEELTGYLKSMVDAKKSVYEKVIYQSDTERTFAEQLEKNEAIKVYAKLPGWFKVPTPLGTYNPDWAVLVHTDAGEQLYFVVETKHSLFTDDLRDRESKKIKCGEAHFAELATFNSPAAEFIKAAKIGDLLARMGK